MNITSQMDDGRCPTCGLQTVDGYCSRCGDKDDPLYGDKPCPDCGMVDEHDENCPRLLEEKIEWAEYYYGDD